MPQFQAIITPRRSLSQPAMSALRVGGRQGAEIARELGDAEKRDLAQALDAALHRWRNPRFDQP